MRLPRKWINSDLSSSRILLFLFSSFNSNLKPYAIIDHRTEQKTAVIRRDDRLILSRYFMLFGVVVFMIVAMAVGTKRLAFGITVSAFVLLVLEYVGSLSYSTSNRLRFFVRSCFPLLAAGLGFELGDEKHRSQNYVNLCETSDDGSSKYSSSGLIVDCIFSGKELTDGEKMSFGGEEEFIDGGAIESLGTEKRRSRRAILKAKIIRRLVPKKFRHLKYCKGSEGKFEDHSTATTTVVKVMERDMDSSVRNLTIRQVISEVESDSEECKYLHFPVGHTKVDDDRELSGELSSQSDHSLKSEADSVIFGSCYTSEHMKRSGVPSKMVTSNIQIDARGGKSGYLKLMVIVLAGLVGGKILSFFLAIGYCCVVKYISTIKKNSANPSFTSTVQNTI